MPGQLSTRSHCAAGGTAAEEEGEGLRWRGLQQSRLGVRLELRSRRKRQNRGQKHRHTDEAQAAGEL